jgi:hypothetical protein
MPFGRNSIASDWIFDSANRSFDVVLLYYHPTIENPLLSTNNPNFTVYHLQDFKWPMIQKLFQLHPQYLSQYDYFFFPDDDIEISQPAIHRLFICAQQYGLQMTQPVLSRDSYKSWKALRKKHFSGMRYLSSVELMCPVMSRVALCELMPTFNLNRSGWGIDILWGEMIRKKFGNKSIAVFDLIETRHTKPVGKGELYDKLQKTAVEERDEIFEKHNIQLRKIITLPIKENSLKNKFKSYLSLKKK